MSDPRLATLGDGGISEEDKAFAATLPDTLSYQARNMLANFVMRSGAHATYIENWLGEIAQELLDAGYLTLADQMFQGLSPPDTKVYAYTAKLLNLRA